MEMPAVNVDWMVRELRARGMMDVIERVAVDHGVEAREILEYGRDPGVVIARRAAWAAIADAFRITPTELAPLLGRRHAQTVIDGIAKHREDVAKAHTPLPGKKLPLMLPGAGARRDCLHDDECMLDVCRAYPAASTAHCPDDCPKFEPLPRHALHAIASVRHRGVLG